MDILLGVGIKIRLVYGWYCVYVEYACFGIGTIEGGFEASNTTAVQFMSLDYYHIN